MTLSRFRQDCIDYVKTTHLENVADARARRWLQIPGHAPHVIPAHKNSRDRFEIRLKPRPNIDFYEETTTLLFSYLISRFRPANVFDVGCATGYFSAVAATHQDVRPDVHAFDMGPAAIQSLKTWTEHADFPGSITPHLAGLSDHHLGTRTIWFVRSKMFEQEPAPEEYLEPWWLRAKFALQGNKSKRNEVQRAEVLLTSIDHFCTTRGLAPGLVKLDVDGYEGKVLRGAGHTLQHTEPIVLLELHRDKLQRDGITRDRVVEPLFDCNYRALFLTDHHSREKCDLVEVGRGHSLFRRQETDMVLFIPQRLAF